MCAIFGIDTTTISGDNLSFLSQTHPSHLSIIRHCLLAHPAISDDTINSPQDTINGITPLCLAAYLGKEVVVRCLLEAGKAKVDSRDRNGHTALMYAGKLPTYSYQ